MKVRLLQFTPNPIEFIAEQASICYDSDPKNPLALVNHLYKNGHHSVFEHVYFTFSIEGISRACSHQLVRHRHSSPTQRSQRYCDEDGAVFIMPESIRNNEEAEKIFLELAGRIEKAYVDLKAAGVPNEDARSVLPNACSTKLVVSMNLRELIHMSNERLCARAQSEIRNVVKLMVSEVAKADNRLSFMLVPKCKSGRIICHSPCGKAGV